MKKKLLILLTLVFFSPFAVNAYELKMDWQKDWGGSSLEEVSDSLLTTDNSIVVIGKTGSNDINDLIYHGGNFDAVIIKYDKDGNMLWQKSWGGNNEDYFNGLIATQDGGFIVYGYSTSTDIEGLTNNGDADAIIVKYDKAGNMLWQKSWGGNNEDYFNGLIATQDSGFIVYGYSSSTDIDDLLNKGNSDAIVVKYDKDGIVKWQNNWGGNNEDNFGDIIQTKNGEIVIIGETKSTNIDGILNMGYNDAIIVKYDKDGILLWQKSWGGNKYDYFHSVIFNSNEELFIVGESRSLDIEGLSNKGSFDGILVKYDKNGNFMWQKSWGGSEPDYFDSIMLTREDEFIVYGKSYSIDIDGLSNTGSLDAIILMFDKDGNVKWQNSYGNELLYNINSHIIDSNGNSIVCIESYQVFDDVYYDGSQDVIIISYDKKGNLLWEENWDGGHADRAKKLFITNENELFVLSDMRNSNNNNDDILILKYLIEYELEDKTTDNGISTVEQNGKYGVITSTPNKGYEVDEIIIKDKEGNVLEVEIISNQDGTYSFELYTDVSVEVLFKEKIENPKTGIFDVITILFVGLFISLSGFLIVKRYNERLEF